jgi:hypothetical protein
VGAPPPPRAVDRQAGSKGQVVPEEERQRSNHDGHMAGHALGDPSLISSKVDSSTS